MKDRYSPLQQVFEGVTGAAAIVSGVAEKTRKHTEPIILFAKDRIVERAKRALQLRIAKATIPSRFRMG